MKEIGKKLDYLDETLKLLGLSEVEVVSLWQQIGRLNGVSISGVEQAVLSDGCIPLTKSNLSQIKIGMIWYEDDTVSFERIPNKKVKAVIELIDSNKIYGDLTASELFEIPEQELDWDDAKRYFEKFSYPCKKNEKIVWYQKEQLRNVCKNYKIVQKTFELLVKKWRKGWYWSSIESSRYRAWYMDFIGGMFVFFKNSRLYVRPVLEFELQ